MNYTFVEPWHQFLPHEGGHVIGLMGSGGKTSLLRILADVYAEAGLKTVLTTTTLCERLSGLPSLTWADLMADRDRDLPDTLFLTAGDTSDDKWRGLAPEQVDQLGGLLPDRVVLAEVDGAAKYPVKLHRPGEPVWPTRTSLAMVVMGTAAVGELTGDVLHRHGRRNFSPLADLKATDVFEWSSFSSLLLASGGYLDQVPVGIPALLALTGLDTLDDSIGLFDFVGRAMADTRLPLAVFCDLAADPPSLRTACRLDEVSS